MEMRSYWSFLFSCQYTLHRVKSKIPHSISSFFFLRVLASSIYRIMTSVQVRKYLDSVSADSHAEKRRTDVPVVIRFLRVSDEPGKAELAPVASASDSGRASCRRIHCKPSNFFRINSLFMIHAFSAASVELSLPDPRSDRFAEILFHSSIFGMTKVDCSRSASLFIASPFFLHFSASAECPRRDSCSAARRQHAAHSR